MNVDMNKIADLYMYIIWVYVQFIVYNEPD